MTEPAERTDQILAVVKGISRQVLQDWFPLEIPHYEAFWGQMAKYLETCLGQPVSEWPFWGGESGLVGGHAFADDFSDSLDPARVMGVVAAAVLALERNTSARGTGRKEENPTGRVATEDARSVPAVPRGDHIEALWPREGSDRERRTPVV